MQIFCDFDGTISCQDTTGLILSRLADPAWLDVEQEWEDGKIGSAECMRRQIAMVEGGRQPLDNILDQVEIDDGFLALVDLAREHCIPLTIVSDGVDYFIHRVFANHHVDGLPIVANALEIRKDESCQLTSPHRAASCVSAAGTCKCAVAGAPSASTIFIGDGRSDFCVASRGHTVFAKGRLAEHCAGQDIPFTLYNTLADIVPVLRNLLSIHAIPTPSEISTLRSV